MFLTYRAELPLQENKRLLNLPASKQQRYTARDIINSQVNYTLILHFLWFRLVGGSLYYMCLCCIRLSERLITSLFTQCVWSFSRLDYSLKQKLIHGIVFTNVWFILLNVIEQLKKNLTVLRSKLEEKEQKLCDLRKKCMHQLTDNLFPISFLSR